jgi:hypothetical protein
VAAPARSLLLALLFAPATLASQDTTGVEIGARVRIEATRNVNDRPIRYIVTGDLAGYDDRQLWVKRPGGTAVDTIPMALVVSARVSREHKTLAQNVTRGVLVGAALGAVYYGVYKGFNRNVNETVQAGDGKQPLSRRLASYAIPLGAIGGGTFGAVNYGEQWLRFGVPGALAGRP